MNSICPICGREFDQQDSSKRPRTYCSRECYKKNNVLQCTERKKLSRDKARLEWAKDEARYLNHLAYECGVDELAEYIYNNHNKRRKTK